MKALNTLLKILLLSFALFSWQTGNAQTDVSGKTTVTVGPLVPGISFHGKNTSKRDFCDFTFKIGDDCDVNITTITVSRHPSGGYGDWDVDDDPATLGSQGANEKDDTDGTPGRITRVDSKGDGKDNNGNDEPRPQNTAGKCIGKGGEFIIDIGFSGVTANTCELCITPTNENNAQVVASLIPGIHEGSNLFEVDNATALLAAMAAGETNLTGSTIAALQFNVEGTGFTEIYEIDPNTGSMLSVQSCGTGETCILELSKPVPPDSIVAFDVFFDHLCLGHTTVVNVMPIFASELPDSIPNVDISVDSLRFGEILPGDSIELVVSLSGAIMDTDFVHISPDSNTGLFEIPLIHTDFTRGIPMKLFINGVLQTGPEHTIRRLPPAVNLAGPCQPVKFAQDGSPFCEPVPGRTCPDVNFNKDGKNIAVPSGPCEPHAIRNQFGDFLGWTCACKLNFPEWVKKIPRPSPDDVIEVVFDPDNLLDEFNEFNNSKSIDAINAFKYEVDTVVAPCDADNICMPVKALQPVSDVIGYKVIMHYDTGKVIPAGTLTVSSDMIDPTHVDHAMNIDKMKGEILILVFLNTSAPAGTRFNGGPGDELFCVDFPIAPGFGGDTAKISVPIIEESYIKSAPVAQFCRPGIFTTILNNLFSSSLKYWDNMVPIPDDNALNPLTEVFGNDSTCNNRSSDAVRVDGAGQFTYDDNNGDHIEILRDIPGKKSVMSVVNGMDALLILKYLLGHFTPNVYQAIAMDVNRSGSVEPGDISQVNQRTVMSITEFAQVDSMSRDWLFIDSTTANSDPAYTGFSEKNIPQVPLCLPLPPHVNCDRAPETYIGIMLGDVYANWEPDQGLKVAGNKVIFEIANAESEGDYIDVPVRFNSVSAVHALDFALQYNQDKLTFVSIEELISFDLSQAHYNKEDQTLRATFSSLEQFEEDVIAKIRFKTKGEVIFAEDFMPVETYLNGSKAEGVVTSDPTTGLVEGKRSVNIYPNPANGNLNIVVSEDARIQIMEINGQQVFLESTVKANQTQKIDLENFANGIYLVKIFNKNFTAVEKISIQN